jgi:hypothetical protein
MAVNDFRMTVSTTRRTPQMAGLSRSTCLRTTSIRTVASTRQPFTSLPSQYTVACRSLSPDRWFTHRMRDTRDRTASEELSSSSYDPIRPLCIPLVIATTPYFSSSIVLRGRLLVFVALRCRVHVPLLPNPESRNGRGPSGSDWRARRVPGKAGREIRDCRAFSHVQLVLDLQIKGLARPGLRQGFARVQFAQRRVSQLRDEGDNMEPG